MGFDFGFRSPRCPQVMDDAHRAHPRHHAPWRGDAGLLAQKLIQQRAKGVFPVPFRGGRSAPHNGIVQAQQHHVGHFPRQRGHRVAGIGEGIGAVRAGEKQAGGVLGLIAGRRAAQNDEHGQILPQYQSPSR